MRAKQLFRIKEEHVLYLGDWVFHVGPTFIETPFGTETKDADLHFYGERPGNWRVTWRNQIASLSAMLKLNVFTYIQVFLTAPGAKTK